MYRRRRQAREINFSFDSFLDVVANVVGIIIRLILVVWVGARSYASLKPLPPLPDETEPAVVAVKPADLPPPDPVKPPPELPPLPDDPLRAELERQRRELALARQQLLEQLRQQQDLADATRSAERDLSLLGSRDSDLRAEAAALGGKVTAAKVSLSEPAPPPLSLEEIRARSQKLMAELTALRQQPVTKKVVRYQTPVSQTVHSEELFFECNNGRVTYIDIATLLAEAQRDVPEKANRLRDRWVTEEIAGPVGAFQLHYFIERQRSMFDGPLGGTPDPKADYRYGFHGEWQLEPVDAFRGEGLDAALRDGSEFRRIADHLDPHQSVVTFWVYPDSFGLYRQLRDWLYERDVIVAGRPLPDGQRIGCSRRGTASRGQ